MLLIFQSVKVLFALFVLNVIVIEMRPNNPPPQHQPQNEDYSRIDESSSSIADDEPMNADSFPLAPDVQDVPRTGVTRDLHIRKLLAWTNWK